MNSAKTKILFILHVPPPVHGSSVVGQYIKNSLIINSTFNCRYINLSTSTKMNDIGKKNIKKLFTYATVLLQISVQIIRFKPQLCYLAITTIGLGFYKDSIAVMLLKLFRVKLIYHLHNKGVRTRQNHFIDNLLYRIVFKNTNVILLSKYLYPDIQKYVTEDSVYYCPNGIPEKQKKIKGEISKKEKNKYVEILYLSNLIQTKGVFVLLDACKILYDKELRFRCTLVGGEGDISKKQIQNKIRTLNMNGTIQYVGKKYGVEKQALFAKTDIFAFPTYYPKECFPLVLLEAMQNKLPVISTFEGGIAEIVDEWKTGFLIPSKNSEALAKRLEVLITNSNIRKEMGKAAYTKYINNYTLNTFENRLNEILVKTSTK
ncbi:glycosyltransferase [Prolixibacteraceae bacterium Z1-6]|uniref:Glycosyltransferase n=1 Tax=Draconibacterium aestuarii TaxID=2998507 RepID=A0A9X3J883_9BACT|nr:glycosyltransferase [Prolixibacteraceae bacterium Z1-6]